MGEFSKKKTIKFAIKLKQNQTLYKNDCIKDFYMKYCVKTSLKTNV